MDCATPAVCRLPPSVTPAHTAGYTYACTSTPDPDRSHASYFGTIANGTQRARPEWPGTDLAQFIPYALAAASVLHAHHPSSTFTSVVTNRGAHLVHRERPLSEGRPLLQIPAFGIMVAFGQISHTHTGITTTLLPTATIGTARNNSTRSAPLTSGFVTRLRSTLAPTLLATGPAAHTPVPPFCALLHSPLDPSRDQLEFDELCQTDGHALLALCDTFVQAHNALSWTPPTLTADSLCCMLEQFWAMCTTSGAVRSLLSHLAPSLADSIRDRGGPAPSLPPAAPPPDEVAFHDADWYGTLTSNTEPRFAALAPVYRPAAGSDCLYPAYGAPAARQTCSIPLHFNSMAPHGIADAVLCRLVGTWLNGGSGTNSHTTPLGPHCLAPASVFHAVFNFARPGVIFPPLRVTVSPDLAHHAQQRRAFLERSLAMKAAQDAAAAKEARRAAAAQERHALCLKMFHENEQDIRRGLRPRHSDANITRVGHSSCKPPGPPGPPEDDDDAPGGPGTGAPRGPRHSSSTFAGGFASHGHGPDDGPGSGYTDPSVRSTPSWSPAASPVFPPPQPLNHFGDPVWTALTRAPLEPYASPLADDPPPPPRPTAAAASSWARTSPLLAPAACCWPWQVTVIPLPSDPCPCVSPPRSPILRSPSASPGAPVVIPPLDETAPPSGRAGAPTTRLAPRLLIAMWTRLTALALWLSSGLLKYLGLLGFGALCAWGGPRPMHRVFGREGPRHCTTGAQHRFPYTLGRPVTAWMTLLVLGLLITAAAAAPDRPLVPPEYDWDILTLAGRVSDGATGEPLAFDIAGFNAWATTNSDILTFPDGGRLCFSPPGTLNRHLPVILFEVYHTPDLHRALLAHGVVTPHITADPTCAADQGNRRAFPGTVPTVPPAGSAEATLPSAQHGVMECFLPDSSGTTWALSGNSAGPRPRANGNVFACVIPLRGCPTDDVITVPMLEALGGWCASHGVFAQFSIMSLGKDAAPTSVAADGDAADPEGSRKRAGEESSPARPPKRSTATDARRTTYVSFQLLLCPLEPMNLDGRTQRSWCLQTWYLEVRPAMHEYMTATHPSGTVPSLLAAPDGAHPCNPAPFDDDPVAEQREWKTWYAYLVTAAASRGVRRLHGREPIRHAAIHFNSEAMVVDNPVGATHVLATEPRRAGSVHPSTRAVTYVDPAWSLLPVAPPPPPPAEPAATDITGPADQPPMVPVLLAGDTPRPESPTTLGAARPRSLFAPPEPVDFLESTRILNRDKSTTRPPGDPSSAHRTYLASTFVDDATVSQHLEEAGFSNPGLAHDLLAMCALPYSSGIGAVLHSHADGSPNYGGYLSAGDPAVSTRMGSLMASALHIRVVITALVTRPADPRPPWFMQIHGPLLPDLLTYIDLWLTSQRDRHLDLRAFHARASMPSTSLALVTQSMADDLRDANLPLRSTGPRSDRFGLVTSATDASTPPDAARALATDGFHIPKAKRPKSSPDSRARGSTPSASIPAEVTAADTAAFASMGLSLAPEPKGYFTTPTGSHSMFKIYCTSLPPFWRTADLAAFVALDAFHPADSTLAAREAAIGRVAIDTFKEHGAEVSRGWGWVSTSSADVALAIIRSDNSFSVRGHNRPSGDPAKLRFKISHDRAGPR